MGVVQFSAEKFNRVLLPLGVAREKRLWLIASKVGDCRVIPRGEGPYCTFPLENAQYPIKQFSFHHIGQPLWARLGNLQLAYAAFLRCYVHKGVSSPANSGRFVSRLTSSRRILWTQFNLAVPWHTARLCTVLCIAFFPPGRVSSWYGTALEIL